MNTGSPPEHPPAAAPAPPPAALDLVELCSFTSLTPSIRRRRLRVNATSDWLVVHPLSVKAGT
ncbi:MAG TPA: hypothetical protein VNY34_00460, partial [Solirubrobacteraceae bacterium]|nr:hypothetical protein [Solirubrobacteraceae bacterium]